MPIRMRDRSGPGLAEGGVAVGDELLRVVQAAAHGAARPLFGAFVAGAGRPGHDRRDDERPEARAEAVLVDSDA